MRNRIFPILWASCVLVLLAWLGYSFARGPVIDSNFLAFLPPTGADAPRAVVDRVEQRFQRRLLVLIGGKDQAVALKAARHVQHTLKESGEFGRLILQQNPELFQQTIAFYFPRRFRILSHGVRDSLLSGKSDAFAHEVIIRYFQPQSTVSSSVISRDPLLLLPQFLSERASEALSGPNVENGVLTVRGEGKTYVVMVGDLSGSPFSLSLQEKVGAQLRKSRSSLTERFPGTDMIVTGFLPHAIAGTASAYRDVSVVGLGSFAGIIFLLFGIFRSWKPLGLSVLSILAGCIGGAAACLAVFGEIHLLTLAFGASLVGISVDYSLHYFSEHFRLKENWSPERALEHIFPGITLGLVTSLIGFAGLFFAPFPGMQGMALFSSVGLIFAYVSLFAWYPPLTRSLRPPRLARALDWVQGYLRFWQRTSGAARLCTVLLLVLVASGSLWLSVRDDIQLLQQADPSVMAEEGRMRDLIGRSLAPQFFLVQGSDQADYLAREEDLTDRLRRLEARGQLTGYLAISDFIPSPDRQAENLRLLKPEVIAAGGALTSVAGRIGLGEDARQAYRADYRVQAASPPVTLQQWLESPVSVPYRHLWIGKDNGKFAGVVHLRGVSSLSALQDVAAVDTNVYFVDPAAAVSRAFANYRAHTIWLTLAAYGVVALLLLLRYGIVGGLAVISVPSIAAGISLGVLGWAGESINLFNVMGLLLVLGIGVDYALFFRETGRDNPSTLLAIALSCLTTLLAFGILAFSSTAAIHSFGVTILVGILGAFLLSPLAGIYGNRRATRDFARGE